MILNNINKYNIIINTYINLYRRNAGKLRLFEVGKSLQAPVSPKRHDKRQHTDLADARYGQRDK